MPDRIYYLLLRKLLKEASQADLHELEALADKYPDNQNSFDEIESFWNEESPANHNPALLQRHLNRLAEKDPTFSFRKIEEPISTPVKSSLFGLRLKKILSVAASFALLMFIVFWVFRKPQPPVGNLIAEKDKTIQNEVRTNAASRTKVVLPDGTQVWVNAASQLLYNPEFGESHRKLTLNGEAYFIVAKNEELPFEIHTKRIGIMVTGTTFNVRAYDDENKAETSVFEGSVQVKQHKLPTKIFSMKPNQKLVINESENIDLEKDLPPSVKKATQLKVADEPIWMTNVVYDPTDSLALETAWVYSTLAFNNESFLELAHKMEKWYGIKIIFQTKKLENIRFTGRFATETITEALEALQFTAKFRFKRNEERIIIY